MPEGRVLLAEPDLDGLDESWMRIALDEARKAERSGEVPVGAIVVSGDRILGRGRNAMIGERDPTAHAEVVALRHAARETSNYRLSGATLYSTIEPCLMCLGAALHARIGRVVYGATDPKIGATAALDGLRSSGALFNHRFEIEGGTLAEESARLLRDFFRGRR